MAKTIFFMGADKTSDLSAGQVSLDAAAKGERPGIITVTPSKDDLDDMKERMESRAGKDKADDMDKQTLIYNASCFRDASYSIVGRKYMRILGLQNKIRTLYDRSKLIALLEKKQNASG